MTTVTAAAAKTYRRQQSTASAQTIADGSYAPLSRPLYLYVNRASLARPEVQAFLRFTFEHIEDVVGTVGYVPLPDGEYAAIRAALLSSIPAS